LQQAYDDHWARLEELLSQVAVPDGCSGAAFAVGGRLAGADLFGRPVTLAKPWPKVARAYALDRLEPQPETAGPVTPEAVAAWLRAAADAPAKAYKSPGLGEDVRLSGAAVVGGSLVVDGEPVHAELFAV
jgi:hypothetical protein